MGSITSRTLDSVPAFWLEYLGRQRTGKATTNEDDERRRNGIGGGSFQRISGDLWANRDGYDQRPTR